MNQKARALLQYTTYMCILTWAVYRFIFLEWIAEKGFVVFFLTVSVIELIVDGTVIFPPAFLAFLWQAFIFASRCSDLIPGEILFFTEQVFFYFLYAF